MCASPFPQSYEGSPSSTESKGETGFKGGHCWMVMLGTANSTSSYVVARERQVLCFSLYQNGGNGMLYKKNQSVVPKTTDSIACTAYEAAALLPSSTGESPKPWNIILYCGRQWGAYLTSMFLHKHCLSKAVCFMGIQEEMFTVVQQTQPGGRGKSTLECRKGGLRYPN